MSDSAVEIYSSQNSTEVGMDKAHIKTVLEYLLSAFRAKLAVQNQTNNASPSQSCPFDFDSFLRDFRGLISDPKFSNVVNQGLKFIIEQGLLDSLLPYLKGSLKVRKSLNAVRPEHGKPLYANEFRIRSSPQPHPVKNRVKSKEEPEIIIHVCDEGKGIWRDFGCRQSVLTNGMAYFSRVAVRGQSLQDVDISVHCEVAIFEWLLNWINAPNQSELIHEINATNVVGLVVSGEFLQIPSLTTICLDYISSNIGEVLSNSPNLGCLSDTLMTPLAERFTNAQLETKVGKLDKTDRITSRFFIQFILLMNQPEPKASLGQFASTSTLFLCKSCKQILTNELSPLVPCREVKFDQYGRRYGQHSKDPTWTLIVFIKELKRELKTWRKVYWRLWGMVHFFLCVSCKFYYPARFRGRCKFHPERRLLIPEKMESRLTPYHSRFFGRRDQEPQPEVVQNTVEEELPIYSRKYPCCQAPVYKFPAPLQPEGCQNRNHVPDLSQCSIESLEILDQFPELIVEDLESDFWKDVDRFRNKSERNSNLGKELEERMRRSPSAGTVDEVSVDSSSSPEREIEITSTQGILAQYGFGIKSKELTRVPVNDLWIWNSDLTTRYNQDMQREMEEKCMVKLATQLLRNYMT